MTIATGASVTRRGRSRGRRWLPMLYLAVMMVAAVLILPSALRPPPDPSTESGALSPDAPPDPNNPDQIIQSQQQAAGGGAGAVAGGSTTTTTAAAGTPPPPGITTTAPPRRKAGSGFCFGKPPRQIESVYAGPCTPGFVGDNGGATSKNVTANEVRLGFTNLGSPAKGRVPDQPTPNESSGTRTFRVFQQYFNQRYETYGRRVVFYGTGDPASASAGDQQAQATSMADDPAFKLFGLYSTSQTMCEDYVQKGLVAMCDPLSHPEYVANRPGLFSFEMDLNQMVGMGVEYACKTLVGKLTKFGGADVNGKPRKFGFVTYRNTQGGVTASDFDKAFDKECGGKATSIELSSEGDPNNAAAAMTKFRAEGVTTILFSQVVGNLILLMSQPNGTYNPEWVMFGNYAIDNNTIASILPKDQSAHLFGISGREWPQNAQASECFRAYHSIDPDNDPDGSACFVHWQILVNMMNGIQGAGPKLTPASFQQALFGLGHRYGQTPWAIGGGYGPDDYTYMDNVGEVWFDSAAFDSSNGAPGAYRWTHGGTRYERGKLTGDDTQLFKAGSAQAPPG